MQCLLRMQSLLRLLYLNQKYPLRPMLNIFKSEHEFKFVLVLLQFFENRCLPASIDTVKLLFFLNKEKRFNKGYYKSFQSVCCNYIKSRMSAATTSNQEDSVIDNLNAVPAIMERMEREDNVQNNEAEEDQEEIDEELFYDKVSKMYIKDTTRAGYQEKSRLLLLWLIEHHPNCVNGDVKSKLNEAFDSQVPLGATVRSKKQGCDARGIENHRKG